MKTNKYGKYQCPCCGYFTFDEELNGTYIICEVCFWEDDPVQLNNPFLKSGANRVSLLEARENFKTFGASEKECIAHVRNPLEDELP